MYTTAPALGTIEPALCTIEPALGTIEPALGTGASHFCNPPHPQPLSHKGKGENS
ncbi:hypothetical protein [Kamptonema formosum]|uniref:hypothetical protein n=1 Tax=Kamptonema formosum TaxID=331992 RepID=UPI00034A1B90|nr:hypothetical protein [Oscillatoria sp. PCC 10802]